ncbi:hypothetical protein Tco_0284419, partial [Tanacetum coccineum]
EYKWKPPHCDLYKIFGHVHDHCPKKVSIPNIVVTPNVPAPTAEKTNPTSTIVKTNDGFQTVGKKKKKKGKSKSTNVGQTGGQSKQPTTTVTSTREGNITMSNSYVALDDESENDVENVYDEPANLFHTK